MSSPMLNTAMKAARAACTILNRAVDNLSTLEVHKKCHSDYVSVVDVACAVSYTLVTLPTIQSV